jgi:undecaprenyl diphosphate synthase
MLLPVIESTEKVTAAGKKLHLRIAVDYSARNAILKAARKLKDKATREDFNSALGALDVDLLIRTGGEKRLSDFLLWECAYAELIFTPVMWPDFAASDLGAAVAEFHSRDRRFGAVPTAALA